MIEKKYFILLLFIGLFLENLFFYNLFADKFNIKSYIFIEGEDAIATNFSRTQTVFFFASGKHTLQLDREYSKSIEYFSRYIFYNSVDREYEIWIAGTPPGGEENPYISPVSIILDGRKYKLFPKKVKVSNKYGVVFYWYLALEGRISVGEHTIEIVVNKPRKYDGRYVFYIDAILVMPKKKSFLKYQRLPSVFPKLLNPKNGITFLPYKKLLKVSNKVIKKAEKKATALIWMKEYKKANDVYDYAVNIYPSDQELQIGYILTLFWLGKKKEAPPFSELLKSCQDAFLLLSLQPLPSSLPFSLF